MANDVQPEAKQPAANGDGASAKRINLVGVDLRGSSMAGRNLDHADFRAADVRGADFSGSSLRYADFRGTQADGANFQNTSLYGAKMQGIEAFGANFRGSDMRQANLDGAYLDKSMMPWSDRHPSPSELADGTGPQARDGFAEKTISERKGNQGGNAGNDWNEQIGNSKGR
jgi:Pentapeptide repeats (8 copies)